MCKFTEKYFFFNHFYLKASRLPLSHILLPHEFASSEEEPNTPVTRLVSSMCGHVLLEGYDPISLASLSTAGLLVFGLKTHINRNCIYTPSLYRAVNTLCLSCTNQSVNAVK